MISEWLVAGEGVECTDRVVAEYLEKSQLVCKHADALSSNSSQD